MALETAATIAELNPANPVGASDSPSTLDDHIRLLKTVLQADALVESDIGATVQAYSAALAGIAAGTTTLGRNKIINGGFSINQRLYASGAAVGAGLYGHDRWKMAASGDTYTFSTTDNKTTVTIPAGKVLRQVIEGLNLQTGTYCLSWEGTAQGKIGAGSWSTSGLTGSITGGTDTTIEFGAGTLANVQLELGSVATAYESRLNELQLCQMYYEKSFPIGTAPAQNAGYTGASSYLPYIASTTAGGHLFVRYSVTKRATPTTITFYNPSAANNKFRNISKAADSGSPGLRGSNGDSSFTVYNPQVAGDAVADDIYIHWAVEAEL